MIVYLSGKISGDPRYREKFEWYTKEAEKEGHIVLNPAALPEGMKPEDYMRINFAMIDVADRVLLLPDWIHSKGARLEKSYCDYIGKPTGLASYWRPYATISRPAWADEILHTAPAPQGEDVKTAGGASPSPTEGGEKG